MTPKEKANELVSKMSTQTYKIQAYAGANYIIEEIGFEGGKNCALIAVDEICEILEDNGFTFTEYHDRTTIEYWLQVKQEIEKL
jgi:hypothetical protein